MVVLTLNLNTNPMVCTFAEPLYKADHIRLVSTITHNVPRTLPGLETVEGTEQGRLTINPGYYTAETLTQKLTERSFGDLEFKVTKPDPDTGLDYRVKLVKGTVSPLLQKLLWLPARVGPTQASFNRLNKPTVYFVHCDMVDERQVMMNSATSPLLGIIPVTMADKAMESHPASEKQPWLPVVEKSSYYHTKITIRDAEGNLVDFAPHFITIVVEIR